MLYDDDRPVISIRARADDEDPEKFPPYILYRPDNGNVMLFYGIGVQGGATQEEAVFWAERFASKNDYRYVAPEGWEAVVGALPQEASE